MNKTGSRERTRKLNDLLNQGEGIILDFDGLIADSEPFHYRAYNEVFERYGHTIDPDEYWVEFTSKGKGIQGEIERYNLKLDVKPEEMRQQKFEIYSRFCQNGDIKLFPEAKQFIQTFIEHHKKRAVFFESFSELLDFQDIIEFLFASFCLAGWLGGHPASQPAASQPASQPASSQPAS